MPNKHQLSRVYGWKRVVYSFGAAICFVLGVIGILLPGLPATPFLLLTSYFLVRTSPRLNDLLLNSRLIGPILKDWQNSGGVRKHVKIQAIVVVCCAVGLTAFLTNYSPEWFAIVAFLAAIGIAVIIKLPSC